MKISSIRNNISFGSYFIPFRVQLVLLASCLIAGFIWIKKNITIPDSSYSSIIHLLVTITLYFILAILTWSFLTAIIPWLIFIMNRKNGNLSLKIKTAVNDPSNSKQPVSISLLPVYPPLFGFLRMRLLYDKGISQKFSLVSSQRKEAFFSSTINGIYNWQLPEIKEYQVNGSIIYFEDMFQLFSFAVTIPAQDTFFTQPEDKSSALITVQPKKTENTNVRIDKIRKVEGEFLNYKNFENNDDVRRIVWKIYAKNKELVVRVPETNDPYASHIYFYASFYNHFRNSLYEQLDAVFLNHYKTVTWNTYLALSKRNLLIKYIPDQPPGTIMADDPLQKVKYIISTSEWQTDKNLDQYFKKDEASILCISSFTDILQLQKIVGTAGKDLVIVFVQLSHAFNTMQVRDWMKWIFVKPSQDSLEKLRFAWNVSPLKRDLIQNEKDIHHILELSECEKLFV